MLTVWMIHVALLAASATNEASVVMLPGITRDAEARVIITLPSELATTPRPNASRHVATSTGPSAARARGARRLVRVTFVRPDGSVTTRLVCRRSRTD